jgi:tRNA (cmo5U34)-methyltransferase
VTEYRFEPEGYIDEIRREIPRYDELQVRTARATEGIEARRVLELGIGTGETARLVLERHPAAILVGIDISLPMLEQARRSLPADRVEELREQGLADPLPQGPFELVFSALAVHHLDASAKADLFRRVASELRPGGRFVLGDVVVPERAVDALTPLTPGYDLPDRIEALVGWLADAGLRPRAEWSWKDVAVLVADRPAI